MHYTDGETRVEAVARELKDRDEALRQLKYNLKQAQDQMKAQEDKKRTNVQFAREDWVFLRLQPHKQHSMVQRIHRKLAPSILGHIK